MDVYQTCMLLSSWSQTLADEIEVFVKKYKEEKDKEPDRLTQTLLKKTRKGGMALLRDLHDLYLIVSGSTGLLYHIKARRNGFARQGIGSNV